MNVKQSTLSILAIGLFNARSRHVASTDPTGQAERNCETLLSPVWHLGTTLISYHIYSATAFNTLIHSLQLHQFIFHICCLLERYAGIVLVDNVLVLV